MSDVHLIQARLQLDVLRRKAGSALVGWRVFSTRNVGSCVSTYPSSCRRAMLCTLCMSYLPVDRYDRRHHANKTTLGKVQTSNVCLSAKNPFSSFRDHILDLFLFSSLLSLSGYFILHLLLPPQHITHRHYQPTIRLLDVTLFGLFWIVLLSFRDHCSRCAPCLTLFFGDHLFACSNFGASPYTLALALLSGLCSVLSAHHASHPFERPLRLVLV